MNGRMKVLGLFAVLGFAGGIAANFAYHTVWPWLLTVFPEVLLGEWVLSGFAGALIAMCLVVIWVYLSGSTDA